MERARPCASAHPGFSGRSRWLRPQRLGPEAPGSRTPRCSLRNFSLFQLELVWQMRDHGGRCPGSVTTGCGRRGTPRARSPGAPVGAWRGRLSKPVPGSAKGTIFTACPVSPDESPLNTGRCRPQMHLRDTRIEDTLVILRLLPGWSWSLPRLPPRARTPTDAPRPDLSPGLPDCCVQPACKPPSLRGLDAP